MKRFLLLMLLTIGATSFSYANNVQVSNVSIVNNGPGDITVKFDLSWENSWRVNVGPANYDGVWVFFKYKAPGGQWKHINLTGSDNVIPSGFSVYQTSNFYKTGAVIYRSAANLGTGNISVTNIQLGVVSNLPYDIDLKAFAVEMVYIPTAPFRPFLGDGNGTQESSYALHYADNTATTSSVIPITCDANSLDDAELETDGIYVYSIDTIQTTSPLGSLDPFPTFKNFWCMKYEISQAGYRDFLNTLDSLQQSSRVNMAVTSAKGTNVQGASASSFGYYIEIAKPAVLDTPATFGLDGNGNNVFDEASDGEWKACSYLNWMDLAAYLDWAGLAPMSEIGYEYICRGASSAGANAANFGEFAWGNNKITSTAFAVSNANTANEYVSNSSTTLGNAVYLSTASNYVLRTGVFATASSNRTTSGASYYGVMDLSGNVEEYMIHLGSVAGRSCKYVPNGNGEIAASGNAKLSVGGAGFWPGMEGNFTTSNTTTCSGTCEVSGSAGIRLRGGGASSTSSELAISDRSAAFTPTARTLSRGGRGVLYNR
ncbi:MAG: hypothetical protein JST36_02435 [Bacteroidetes bacterium]|nr:hypothetical protein [Bacteroidota bacterium]